MQECTMAIANCVHVNLSVAEWKASLCHRMKMTDARVMRDNVDYSWLIRLMQPVAERHIIGWLRFAIDMWQQEILAFQASDAWNCKSRRFTVLSAFISCNALTWAAFFSSSLGNRPTNRRHYVIFQVFRCSFVFPSQQKECNTCSYCQSQPHRWNVCTLPRQRDPGGSLICTNYKSSIFTVHNFNQTFVGH